MKNITSRAGLGISALAFAVALAGCSKAPQVEQAAASSADAVPAAGAAPATAAPRVIEELNDTQRQANRISFNNCNLEALDGMPFGNESEYVPANKSKIVLGGWLGASNGAGVPTEPTLLLMLNERIWSIPIVYNVDRPDVAVHTGDIGLQHSGFNIDLDASTLPIGVYRVLLADGMGSYCDNGRRLKL